MSSTDQASRQARRQAAMAVLAHSATVEIARHLDRLALPAHESLREPENGLVMVRGQIGGDGAAFNLGEATVSRVAAGNSDNFVCSGAARSVSSGCCSVCAIRGSCVARVSNLSRSSSTQSS